MTIPVWQKLSRELNAGTPAALISVLEARGSTPRETGARMLVTQAGTYGTIGGGALEHMAIQDAQKRLLDGENTYWTHSVPLGPDLGQCCGGHVTLLTEILASDRVAEVARLAECEREGRFQTEGIIQAGTIMRKPASSDVSNSATPSLADFKVGSFLFETFGEDLTNLAIFGCGHVARALILSLATLPFKVTLLDPRKEAFPKHVPQNVSCIFSERLVHDLIALPSDTQILIMTHDHAIDLDLVNAALIENRFPYIGLIGSSTKKARFVKRLREAGRSDDDLNSLICPIGLTTLKSKEPRQISIGVAAQLLMYREQARTLT